MGKHFVLVHGAWHGGWVWDGVIAALEEEGHTAEAPTMPGHNPGDDRSGVTFDTYVDHLVKTLQEQSQPVVLVGHSSAGFMMQAAVPRAADKVEQVVFHNAFILPDQACQFDLVPPEVADGMTAAANASPDNCVPVDEDFVRGALMGGEPQDKVDSLIARLTPQPLALFTTKVSTAAFSELNVSKSYLFCKDDASLPPGAYLGMAQALGRFDLVQIPGGHETMWVAPKEIAKAFAQMVNG
jgi:pimeloyl-ACP methyl ester carboxylesterase